jgi:hypothetical protein
MHVRGIEYFFCVRRMSENPLPKKVLDAVWVVLDGRIMLAPVSYLGRDTCLFRFISNMVLEVMMH